MVFDYVLPERKNFIELISSSYHYGWSLDYYSLIFKAL